MEDCIPAGETGPVIPDAPPCCGQAHPISVAIYDEEIGICQEADGAFLCSECGNGVCEPWENPCNCEEDCLAGDCVPAGEIINEFEEPDAECCPGLERRVVADLVDGECIPLPCACFVCVLCGDRECGPGENLCTCPEDCGQQEPEG